jgi:peroxiredoxin
MKAPQFDLSGVDGKRHSPQSARGDKGLVVMFICNHCPYVKAVIDRIVRDCNELQSLGIGSIAVMSNDPSDYPEDSFENMKRVAREKGFPFPYVIDETQDVARAYDAVCTPEFFGFNSALEAQYHGRLDASRRDAVPNAKRELFEAMKLIAETGKGPKEQIASVGCSIKWKK